MKITSVSTAVVAGNFDWTILKIETEGGLVGWGEGFFAPRLPDLIEEIGQVIVGEDARNINEALARVWWHGQTAGPVEGILGSVASAIETALFDLAGKDLGVPIWRLLGGCLRDTVPVYADCHGPNALESFDWLCRARPAPWDLSGAHDQEDLEPEDVAAHLRSVRDKGYSLLKIDLDLPELGLGPGSRAHLSARHLTRIGQMVSAARAAVGDDVDLALDCHWILDLSDAIRLNEVVAPSKLRWVEEPLAHGEIDGLATLCRQTATPICTGELYVGLRPFEQVLARGAAHVLHPDVQRIGGIGVARSVAASASVYGVPVALHNIASPIGFLASVHLGATLPNLIALEFHSDHVPMWDQLVVGPEKPIVHQGRVAVPEAPGLGAELDLEVARAYAKPGTSFFGEPVR